ncbi:hypothetical protein RW1_080_00160 [Rhodococcus wratislaviensis NBRC 100605]|uniref:Transposase IS30-like HTH domain-containing protein n=1 Tax=Rhodococcus wratislaviensis NBRC 100605 TaxID=1219028 RepID=X0Q076_RHOWR|nr:hypothetical protein RW1_080_00160 [Rhodococcus wratislaviensis NBRC 100605]
MLPEDSRSGRYLSLLERERIAVLHAQQCSVREIARRLNRAPSTISRELRRNMRAGDDGNYDAGLAHSRAREQTRRRRRSIFARDSALRTLVQDKLKLHCLPGRMATLWNRACRSSHDRHRYLSVMKGSRELGRNPPRDDTS